MIYVEMYGRLGNQFFRYAVARKVQLKYYPNEEICFNFNQINALSKDDDSFYNVLNDFNVCNYKIYDRDGKVLNNETNAIQKIVCYFYYSKLKKMQPEEMNRQLKYQLKWKNILNKLGLYWYRTGFCKIEKCNQENKFISGNFESPEYFNDIRDVLLKEFKPKADLLKKNRQLFSIIKSSNSVCVSVRRGDFETNSEHKKLHSLCDEEYFVKAINLAADRIEKPVFVFFSDDIDWVKENIRINYDCYYESGDDPVWEKLRLMSNCKNFIISNSTFSWWAQWLSENKSKLVISPSRWFNNDYHSPLIEDSFITINV